jgi:hypothetical protein
MNNKRMTLSKCSMSILKYLMVFWEFILRKFHIDLMTGAVPKHFRPHAITVIHLEAFKKKLIHLVKIGVLMKW